MSKETLPCPFCNSSVTSIYVVDYDSYAVNCLDCNAFGPKQSTTDEAVFAWNRRFTVGSNQEVMYLTKEESARFAEALINPPEPNEALKELMKGRLK